MSQTLFLIIGMKFLNLFHIVEQAQEKFFLQNKHMGQKTMSCIGPSIWKSLSDWIKKANSLNTSNHNAKKHYQTWITHNVYYWIHICVCFYIYLYVDGCVYMYIWILLTYLLTYLTNLSRCLYAKQQLYVTYRYGFMISRSTLM